MRSYAFFLLLGVAQAYFYFDDIDRIPGKSLDGKTQGYLVAGSFARGLLLKIYLHSVPPHLVLTAWLIWVPGGVTEPPIFRIANHAAPCAPYNAAFTTGLAREPNEFHYTDSDKACLRVNLNFNPTNAGEGALTREVYCYQKDVLGIQDTQFKHLPAKDKSGTKVYVPTSSDYLRRYDPKTGFEMLGPDAHPEVVRSPVKAMGIEVIAHTDRTTHGISQGVGGVDHYGVMFFNFTRSIGVKTVIH